MHWQNGFWWTAVFAWDPTLRWSTRSHKFGHKTAPGRFTRRRWQTSLKHHWGFRHQWFWQFIATYSHHCTAQLTLQVCAWKWHSDLCHRLWVYHQLQCRSIMTMYHVAMQRQKITPPSDSHRLCRSRILAMFGRPRNWLRWRSSRVNSTMGWPSFKWTTRWNGKPLISDPFRFCRWKIILVCPEKKKKRSPISVG